MAKASPEKRSADFRKLVTTANRARIKFYDLFADRSEANTKASDHAIAKLLSLSSENQIADDSIGIAICHQGRDANWLVLGQWQDGGIIELQTFSSSFESPDSFTPIKGNFIVCVWELGIVEFERLAWRQHVLNDSPNVDAYLSETLTGMV